MILNKDDEAVYKMRAPRIRGDDPYQSKTCLALSMCSLHPRG